MTGTPDVSETLDVTGGGGETIDRIFNFPNGCSTRVIFGFFFFFISTIASCVHHGANKTRSARAEEHCHNRIRRTYMNANDPKENTAAVGRIVKDASGGGPRRGLAKRVKLNFFFFFYFYFPLAANT